MTNYRLLGLFDGLCYLLMLLQWRRQTQFLAEHFSANQIANQRMLKVVKEWLGMVEWNQPEDRESLSRQRVYDNVTWESTTLQSNHRILYIYILQSLSNVEPNSQELGNKNPGSRGGIPSCQLLILKASEAPQPTRLLPFLLSSHWKLFDKTRFLKTPHNWDRDTEKWNKNWTYLGTSFLLLSFHSDKKIQYMLFGEKNISMVLQNDTPKNYKTSLPGVMYLLLQ